MSVRFIADIGSNHDGNIGRANELIYQAKEAGCWGVKFQMFNSELPNKPEREWLNPDWLDPLSKQAHYYGMQFGCSVFYETAVDEVRPYVDFIKVTSNYGLREKLIQKILSLTKYKDYVLTTTGIPVYASYPPSMFYEDGVWIDRPKSNHSVQFSLLAIPEYPTPLEYIHLKQLRNLDGWSDHSRKPGVIYKAVFEHLAKVVEFHLDLEDGQGWEYHYGHCWLPEEIKEVIKNVKEGFEAD